MISPFGKELAGAQLRQYLKLKPAVLKELSARTPSELRSAIANTRAASVKAGRFSSPSGVGSTHAVLNQSLNPLKGPTKGRWGIEKQLIERMYK